MQFIGEQDGSWLCSGWTLAHNERHDRTGLATCFWVSATLLESLAPYGSHRARSLRNRLNVVIDASLITFTWLAAHNTQSEAGRERYKVSPLAQNAGHAMNLPGRLARKGLCLRVGLRHRVAGLPRLAHTLRFKSFPMLDYTSTSRWVKPFHLSTRKPTFVLCHPLCLPDESVTWKLRCTRAYASDVT